MTAAFSSDLRKRVITLRNEGVSAAEIANRLMVSHVFVHKIVNQWRETGCYEAPGGRRGRISPLDACESEIIRLVEEKPDATLQELVDQLPVKTSSPALHRKLKALGLTRKKNALRRRTESA